MIWYHRPTDIKNVNIDLGDNNFDQIRIKLKL